MSIRIRTKSQLTCSLFHQGVVRSSNSGTSLLGFQFQFCPLRAVRAWELSPNLPGYHFPHLRRGEMTLTCLVPVRIREVRLQERMTQDSLLLRAKNYLSHLLQVLGGRWGENSILFLLPTGPGSRTSRGWEHDQPPERGARLTKHGLSLEAFTWK